MMEITGSGEDRCAAADLARWCEDSVQRARRTGTTVDTRLMVQQTRLIIAALQEYANGRDNEMVVRVGAMLAERDQLRDLLLSCKKAMEVSMRFAGSVTDWSQMISAIDGLVEENDR